MIKALSTNAGLSSHNSEIVYSSDKNEPRASPDCKLY